jgi:hypothetical protein
MQAITVLLLEYAQGAVHVETAQKPSLLICVEKLTSWLATMRTADGVADRAYKLVNKVMGRHISNDDAEVIEEPKDIPHNEASEMMISNSRPHFYPDYEPSDDNIAKASAMVDNSMFNQGPQYQRNAWPSASMSDNVGPQMNSSNLDIDAMVWPLNDESTTQTQFGQEQMPMFFGNQFMTDFDQEMDYFGGSIDFQDFNMQYRQD